MDSTKLNLIPLEDRETDAFIVCERLNYKDEESCLGWHTFTKPNYNLIPN